MIFRYNKNLQLQILQNQLDIAVFSLEMLQQFVTKLESPGYDQTNLPGYRALVKHNEINIKAIKFKIHEIENEPEIIESKADAEQEVSKLDKSRLTDNERHQFMKLRIKHITDELDKQKSKRLGLEDMLEKNNGKSQLGVIYGDLQNCNEYINRLNSELIKLQNNEYPES